MKRKILLFFTEVLLMAGCTATSSPPNGTSTQQQVVASLTPIMINTIVPTTSETSTPFFATQITSNNIVQNCLEISDNEIPLNEIANHGTVVIGGTIDASPYLLDFQTGLHYDLPFQAKHDIGYFFGFHTSPDGNKFAYVEPVENSAKELVGAMLWIVDAKGNVITSQVIAPEIPLAGFTSTNSWRWLDNMHIEFYFQQTKRDGTVKIFDLSTKVWKNHFIKLPNFYTDFDLERSEWLVEYSPNLDWVIYLGGVNGHGLGPSVWDETANKIIWQMPGVFAGANIPSWSPIGNEVAITVNGTLYRISKNGTAISSPYLGTQREIVGFSWSPNGEHIALLVRINQPQIQGYLMMYDIQGNTVTDYCIEDDLVSAINLPVWSADGQQLFYKIGTTNPIVVDIGKNAVFGVSDDIELLEWMNSIP